MSASAREIFETLALVVAESQRTRLKLEELDHALTRVGGGVSQVAVGSTSTDSLGARVASLTDKRQALKSRLASSEADARRLQGIARSILYGKSGRGGLAAKKSATDADILFCRYIDLMSWPQIGAEVADESANPSAWCKMRAKRALEYIDRVGIESLIMT